MNYEFKTTPIEEIRALLAQKELFIFDLDGTLFNSLGDLAPAVNFALKQFGIQEIEKETVRTCIGNGSRNLVRRAIAAGIFAGRERVAGEECAPGKECAAGKESAAGEECAAPLNVRDAEAVAAVLNAAGYDDAKVDEVLKTYSHYYWEHCTENTVPYEGVLEILQRINAVVGTSRPRIAVMLTNKPVLPAQKILEKFGLIGPAGEPGLISANLCGDTAPERKPGPGGIWAMLEKAGGIAGNDAAGKEGAGKIPPEKAVMIGDDTPDLMAARNAGIDCITLLEGFGRPENLLPLQPKYTVGHIKDFADLV